MWTHVTPFRPSKAMSSRKRHQFDEPSLSVPGMQPLKVTQQVQKSSPATQLKEDDLDKGIQKAFVGKQSSCLIIIAFHTMKAEELHSFTHRTASSQMEDLFCL